MAFSLTLTFHLVQERLTNIIRPAEAQAVKITLKKMENQVKLTVRDNGLGIRPDRFNDPRSLVLIGLASGSTPGAGPFTLGESLIEGQKLLLKFH